MAIWFGSALQRFTSPQYAHASELLVKRGETIKRARSLQVGQSGEMGSPHSTSRSARDRRR